MKLIRNNVIPAKIEKFNTVTANWTDFQIRKKSKI